MWHCWYNPKQVLPHVFHVMHISKVHIEYVRRSAKANGDCYVHTCETWLPDVHVTFISRFRCGFLCTEASSTLMSVPLGSDAGSGSEATDLCSGSEPIGMESERTGSEPTVTNWHGIGDNGLVPFV